MADLLQVFLLSMTPLGELRLSIPLGIAIYKLDVFSVFLVSVIGNMIPIFLFLLFLKYFSKFLAEKWEFYKKVYTWWEESTKNRHYKKIEKYGATSLALFVAIPLPFTGAWTAALLATLMDMPIKKSLPAITAGVAGAGALVTVAVVMGINVTEFFGWQTLVGAIIFFAAIYYYITRFKKL
jgi:uncharacterized membrane protein